MAYRTDPETAARERARLIERIHAREAAWTDLFWREVAPEHGVAAPALLDGLDHDALVARASALERLESDAPRIVPAWAAVPPVPRTRESVELDAVDTWRDRPAVLGGAAPLWPQLVSIDGTTQWAVEVAHAVRDAIGGHAIDCRLSTIRARNGVWLALALVAGAPRGAGTLAVRPETLLDDLGRMIGLRRDVQVGAPDFDGVFAIDGDPEAARAILVPAVRRDLLHLGIGGAPELAVGGGVAELRLRLELFDLDRGALRRAVSVVLAARAAPVRPLRAR